MPRKVSRPMKFRRMRRNMRRGIQSEGLPRRATTSIVVGVAVTGNQGLDFTPAQLLADYFRDPRLIRIYRYRIKLSILDYTQQYFQYQVLCVTDNIQGPFVCMTQPKQVSNVNTVQSVSIARDRSFWIRSSDEATKILDIKFLTFNSVKIILEITTYFNIEQDIINALSYTAKPYENDKKEEIEDDFLDLKVNSPPPSTSNGRRRN